MNDFTADGTGWLKRASLVIPDRFGSRWNTDMAHDSVLFFAFGMEKLLKGILYDVNPLFVYKNASLENVCGLVYREKMAEGPLKGFDARQREKKIDSDVHSAGTSLHYARHFSECAVKYTPVLRELFDLRSFIAHQTTYARWQMDAQRFVQKHFGDVVPWFADELKIDLDHLIDKSKSRMLIEMSDALRKEEALAAKMKDLVDRHVAIWEKKKQEPAKVAEAQRLTQAVLKSNVMTDPIIGIECPVCDENTALLRFGIEWEYDEGRHRGRGYAEGLTCHFCDVKLETYEELGFFDLDEYVNQEPYYSTSR